MDAPHNIRPWPAFSPDGIGRAGAGTMQRCLTPGPFGVVAPSQDCHDFSRRGKILETPQSDDDARACGI
jgi:hypothetical protein